VAGEPESNEVEKKSNQVSDLDTEHSYSNIKRKPLTNKQKDILNFCSVPRTASEIMDRLGISNQTRNRERHIMPLVTAGYLQLTNPDNPKASNQKYKRISLEK
jgi:ATP-dependent DNA helicase RecG